ncbi:helix-turn-helix domain-containing protein [Nonomuraea sp. NPDC049400]|uniref:helix-turn-helix domain-containing protein n=1 Tax=Nonomuraea sp. NPDC049400 TaxID=3364352 RepID=UPI0037A5DD65
MRGRTGYSTRPFRALGWAYRGGSSTVRNEQFATKRRESDFELKLGAVRVGTGTFAPPRIWRPVRSPALVHSGMYEVVVPIRGTVRASWDGRDSVLEAGDLYVHDIARLDRLAFHAPGEHGACRIVTARVPVSLAVLPMGGEDQVLGRRLTGSAGVGALLAGFLTRLTADAASYQPADGPRLGKILLDLVTAFFAHLVNADPGPDPSTRQQWMVAQIEKFIRQHLDDPRLSPRTIAAAHHISLSYLHQLFKIQGTTVSVWIRGQRLENARRDLADPELSGTSVYDIASRWGFAHAATFSRAFRAVYGIAPRDYRCRAFHSQV